jgi:aspartyl-tRNA(Asn)/glutamyl-tRNA(Gln) amidotransferase subunit A
VIIGPTTPSTALPVGSSKNHPMFGEVSDVLVEPSTIAGLPGINIPIGLDKNGLPIGMQIIGPQFSEGLLLSLAEYLKKRFFFQKQGKTIENDI